MTIFASSDRTFAKALRKIVTRSRSQGASVEKSVRTILKAVERGGDRAVLRYTKKFDRLSLKLDRMRVTPEEVKGAYYHIRKDEG
ncbi:MAG: histidinol dehydrogenase, partial [Nitrospira sp.]